VSPTRDDGAVKRCENSNVLRASTPDLLEALCPAHAARKNLVTLWKDADPDIPILKEAKAEYAKLR
jgi:hypothetical protein